MTKLEIFEPAMCCPTGLCGIDVDPELLRISTVANTLEKNGIKIERFNLSNAPQEFIKNVAVTDFIRSNGAEALPITVLNGEIIIRGRYPKNEEFAQLLNIPLSSVVSQSCEALDDNNASYEGCCGGSNTSNEACCTSSNSPDEACCTSNNSSDEACCTSNNASNEACCTSDNSPDEACCGGSSCCCLDSCC